jgi:N-acetylmuramoyl-L-alanine amidase
VWHDLKDRALFIKRGIRINIASEKTFLNNLYKIGYSKKAPKNITKNNYQNLIIRAFQRRYRQELIDGKIDGECLVISKNLIKND